MSNELLPSQKALHKIRLGVGTSTDSEATGNGGVIAVLKRLRTLLGNIYTKLSDEVAIYQGASAITPFTIPSGSYGVGTYPADLGGYYDIIRVYCQNASYIPAMTYMAAYCSPSYPQYPMVPLYDDADPGTLWAPTTHVPSVGGFDFLLTPAAGSRWISLALVDNQTSSDLVFYLYGVHKSQ